MGRDATGSRSDRSSRGDALEYRAILLQCRAGLSEGYERLAALWAPRLWAHVAHLAPDHADDIYGELWAQVLANVHRVRDPERLPGWLYRVAHNVTMMHLRRQRAFVPLPPEEPLAPGATTEELVLAEADAAELRRALAQLHTTHCEVLTLHFLEGFPLKEIAQITGVPVGTVKSRLHHAKQHLRTALKREGRDHGGA